MTERIAEASPRPKARIAGVFYLLTFLTGVLALVAGAGLVVPGDPAATATNILAHASSLQPYFTANLLAVASCIGVTALFYDLFKPVNGSLSFSQRSSASWGAPFRA
jgi:membrane protein DedA with SNARE-associated domain